MSASSSPSRPHTPQLPPMQFTDTLDISQATSISSSSSTSSSAVQSPTSVESLSISNSSIGASPYLLPISAPSSNHSRSSLNLEHVASDNGYTLEDLPGEVKAAAISIAADGSFVETPSGPAARELKRIFDQRFGVGLSVRSPYAITAFVNQHGKQMFRIGRRELEAPAAAAADAEARVVSRTQSHAPSPELSTSPKHTKRASRMSVHAFLPPGKWHHSSSSTSASTSSSRPHTANPAAPRKLRKTRSNSDLFIDAQPGSASSAHGGTGGGTNPGNTVTVGRQHSQSVTEADMSRYTSSTNKSDLSSSSSSFHLPPHSRSAVAVASSSSSSLQNQSPGQLPPPHSSTDIFYEIMDWLPSSPGHRRHHMPGDLRTFNSKPFGNGVLFDSPSHHQQQRLFADFLPQPRFLREMQSFESGLTARQDDAEALGSPNGGSPTKKRDSVSLSKYRNADSKLTRQSSAVHLGDHDRIVSQMLNKADAPTTPTVSDFALSQETQMQSRYSTEVFDVLQTYRGLPLLDKFSPDDETTVIKFSLSSEDTAAPRDDPRFVIWGELTSAADDVTSLSHGSLQDSHSMNSLASSISRKRSTKGGSNPPSSHMSIPAVQVSSGSVNGERPTKILLAATIERWIAQLTSVLNYDELLNFFLTYRTYVSSVDLCHLLIARFHWSLEKPSSPKDELTRRVVRLRTFVAIRYWVLTFFTVDFLPNRELRLVIAGWLNTLIKDPVLKRHQDGVNTVRKLKRILNECKKTHAKIASKREPKNAAKSPPTHLLGEKFAEAIRQSESSKEDDESDLDLDFDTTNEVSSTDPVSGGFQSDPVNAHLSSAHISAGGSGIASKRSIVPLTQSFAEDPSAAPFIASPTTLPIHHNTLSRVFVNTIGRLGRWKRVLNSRATGPGRSPLGGCADVSAFDLELTVSRDLLTVNGGVEKYLQMIDTTTTVAVAAANTTPVTNGIAGQNGGSTAGASSDADATGSGASVASSSEQQEQKQDPKTEQNNAEPLVSQEHVRQSCDDSPPLGEGVDTPTADLIVTPTSTSRASFVSSVTDFGEVRQSSIASYHSGSSESFGAPIEGNSRYQYPWGFDVVSIDELDLSDTSSDDDRGDPDGPAVPPGLRKLKKLPLRRNFELAPRPESVSSMGIVSRDSIASETSSTSSLSMPGLGGNIQQWQMNALIDSLSDDEEHGDVEAALKKLEGEINPRRQREKQDKVDGWVKSIQKRMARGDYGDNAPRFLNGSDDEDEDEEGGAVGPIGFDDAGQEAGAQTLMIPNSEMEFATTPIATQVSHTLTLPGSSGSPSRGNEAKPMLEDAVPIEILQSRVPAKTMVESPLPISFSPPSRFVSPESSITPARMYRSMVLLYRADTLAEHFSMIDRELIMGVKFEELILDDWMACQEVNVLDWTQYLKDRARWKVEARFPEKTSALAAVRARFNLMANFAISEIVLTRPSDRPLVVGKFIRIAWKAYSRSNFSTLTAIIYGLKSNWVDKAMRKNWNKVGIWETRMFNDLKEYTTSADNFRYLRHGVDSIADAKALDEGSRAQSATSGTESKAKADIQQPSACIPFIGAYLSQLHDLSRLPDLIDPTAPNETVGIDPVTANFDAPAHPEVFSTLAPLPHSLQLEPLINVHKQRMIAGVIKSLVAGQHLASKVSFSVDKKLFLKCTKLTALDSQQLQRAMNNYSD